VKRTTRLLLCLIALALAPAHGCSDDNEPAPPADGTKSLDIPDFAGITDCPNSMATDENCPQKCFKERGVGVSYCADKCSADNECRYVAHAWMPTVGLVCPVGIGYCTRRCMSDVDCVIGKYTDKMRCDPTAQVCVSAAAP
jgi:hypothetical protein